MLEKKFPTSFTFRVTEETYEKVKKLAKEQDLSMAQITRRLITECLSEHENKSEYSKRLKSTE